MEWSPKPFHHHNIIIKLLPQSHRLCTEFYCKIKKNKNINIVQQTKYRFEKKEIYGMVLSHLCCGSYG